MIWYVRLGKNIVGWVVAANHEDAYIAALLKFEMSIEFGPVDVIPRTCREKRHHPGAAHGRAS